MNDKKFEITVRKLHDEPNIDDDYVSNPEESLDILERLRLEAGKLIYDYPTSFQRTITVVRKRKS